MCMVKCPFENCYGDCTNTYDYCLMEELIEGEKEMIEELRKEFI